MVYNREVNAQRSNNYIPSAASDALAQGFNGIEDQNSCGYKFAFVRQRKRMVDLNAIFSSAKG